MSHEPIMPAQGREGAFAGSHITTSVTGEIETLSDLTGSIYDAALDPALWPDVLAGITRFVGGHTASLISGDATRKPGNILCGDGGIDRHDVQLRFDGVVDGETLRRVQLLAPHVRRAVLIGRAIALKAAEAATLADTLDGIAAGTFMVDASARIVHANAAGRAMLAQGGILCAPNGWLTANDGQVDRALREAFAGNGDAAADVKGITVPLVAREGELYVAHVLPLTPGVRRTAGAGYAAVAALLVHKAALTTPSRPEVIARTYRLTRTELRVLLAIVEGGGVPEVAKALGIGEATVKSHLKHLFAKTGAKRQADLVKLLAAFSSPLTG
jgi:DNA-binding CsgD family transcriptional regulator